MPEAEIVKAVRDNDAKAVGLSVLLTSMVQSIGDVVEFLGLNLRPQERLSPDAAASLREGMEETLTVVRLGVPELLRRTLATTNPIESAFSVAENVTRRVKCWREGDMRQRWCIAGLMRAESKFRRVKGHRHMAQLLKALDRLVLGKGLDDNRKIA